MTIKLASHDQEGELLLEGRLDASAAPEARSMAITGSRQTSAGTSRRRTPSASRAPSVRAEYTSTPRREAHAPPSASSSAGMSSVTTAPGAFPPEVPP